MALGNNQILVVNTTSIQLPLPMLGYATYTIVMESLFYINLPIALFGMFANSANITVFYRMGFSVVSNISLFALAISDLISLVCMLITMFSHHPDLLGARVILLLTDIGTLISPIHYCSSAFGSWIMAVISVERSYCVVFPMKVKMVFTRKTVFWLLIGMLIYQTSGIPQYASHTIISVVSPLTNKTIYIVDHSKFKAELALMSVFISFSLPTIICFIVVALATIFLIIKFKQSLQLRKTMAANKQEETISSKDAVLMRSVISICIIYIFGYVPVVGCYVLSAVESSFHIYDPYLGNVVRLVLAVSYTAQLISSSVNIFVYWNMSSKYKDTFKAFFRC